MKKKSIFNNTWTKAAAPIALLAHMGTPAVAQDASAVTDFEYGYSYGMQDVLFENLTLDEAIPFGKGDLRAAAIMSLQADKALTNGEFARGRLAGDICLEKEATEKLRNDGHRREAADLAHADTALKLPALAYALQSCMPRHKAP